MTTSRDEPLALELHARDRRTLREARMRAPHRHHRGRGGDEDPREVPARARERGMGPAARAHVRQDVPAHVRRVPRARRRSLVEEYRQRYERPATHGAARRSRPAGARAPRRAGAGAASAAVDPRRSGFVVAALARSTCSGRRATSNDDPRRPTRAGHADAHADADAAKTAASAKQEASAAAPTRGAAAHRGRPAPVYVVPGGRARAGR